MTNPIEPKRTAFYDACMKFRTAESQAAVNRAWDNIQEILAAHAPQQWIPVSERMPEYWGWKGKDVAIDSPPEHLCMVDGDRMVLEWEEGDWVSFGGHVLTAKVTHWQPLPAPPVPGTAGQQTEFVSERMQGVDCPECEDSIPHSHRRSTSRD